MKELVVRAGKYVSVGILCFACLPVLLPLLFLLSVFGFTFGLPLGCALAGFLYLRNYVGLLYRKLPTTLAGRCSSWGRQPPSSPTFFVDLPVSDLQAIETFESVDPEFDAVVVSKGLREGQRRSVEGANDPDIQSGLGAVSIYDAAAFAVTGREGIDADPFVKDGTRRNDPSREDGTRREGTDDDTSNENANSREVVDGDILAEDETTRDLIGDDTSADGGTKREGKDSTSVEDGTGREGTGHVISEENKSVRQANEDDTSAKDGTREEEKDEDTEDGNTREGKGDVTSEETEPLRQVNEDDTSAEDGTKEDEKDEDTSNENVSTREGTDEDTFAEVETSRDVREYDTSADGGIRTDEKDSTSVEEATEETCQGTQIRGEEGETALVEESELQEEWSTEVSGEESGIPSQVRDGYCQARGKEAEPTVEGDAQLQHLGRSKEFADEDASIRSNCSTSVPGDSPPSHDGQVGGKEAEPAVDEDGQLQPTGRSKDFSDDEDAGTGSNNSISLQSDSPHSGHGNSHAIGVESVHEPRAERLTAADSVDDSSSRSPILDQREQQSEETCFGDYFGKGADDDFNNAAVVDRVEGGGLQTEEEEAPGDVGHDSLLIGALQQFIRENDRKSASSMVAAVHPDAVHDTHKDEGPTQPDGVRNVLPHQANEDDIWICKECGWKYPNAKPSAKIRRNHKKHCKGGTPPRTPAPEDGTLTKRLSQSYEGVEKLRTDSKSSSPLANSSTKLTPIERTVNTESVLDGGGTFTRGVEANDLMSEHSTREADLPTRSSATSNSPSDVIQDEPESITGGPSAALAEEERNHSSPLRSQDDLSSPDHARLSDWVAFDDTGGAAVSSAESGGQDKESGVGSESFRSAANELPFIASDSFRSVTDEFPDKWSAVESHGDNEQDQVAQVQHERQLSDDLNSVKGIVGDKYVSTGNLLIDIEELSGFLGIELPPRGVKMSEIEWAKLAIEVMKVVVGID